MVFKIRLSVSYKFIEKRGFCILYEKNLYFMRKATGESPHGRWIPLWRQMISQARQ